PALDSLPPDMAYRHMVYRWKTPPPQADGDAEQTYAALGCARTPRPHAEPYPHYHSDVAAARQSPGRDRPCHRRESLRLNEVALPRHRASCDVAFAQWNPRSACPRR